MFHVLQRKPLKAGSSTSRLRFESDIGPVGVGSRFLLLDGKRAYDLGINCQTCATLFQRLPGANQSLKIQETAEALRHVVQSLDEEVVSTVARGLPEDEYIGAQQTPLCFWYSRAIRTTTFSWRNQRFGAKTLSGVCLTTLVSPTTGRVSGKWGNGASSLTLWFQCIPPNG